MEHYSEVSKYNIGEDNFIIANINCKIPLSNKYIPINNTK